MAKTAEEKAAAKAAKDAEKAAAKAADASTPVFAPVVNGPVVKNGAVADGAADQPKPSKTAVTVRYRDHLGSEASRTFSKEVHGDDFAKLADEFKVTNASKIIE